MTSPPISVTLSPEEGADSSERAGASPALFKMKARHERKFMLGLFSFLGCRPDRFPMIIFPAAGADYTKVYSLELTIENPISNAEGRTAPTSGRSAQHPNGVPI